MSNDLKFEIIEEIETDNEKQIYLRSFERLVEIIAFDKEEKRVKVYENGKEKCYLLEEEGNILVGEKAIISIKELHEIDVITNMDYLIQEKVIHNVVINQVNGETLEIIDNDIYRFFELRCENEVINGAKAAITITQRMEDEEHVSEISYHTSVIEGLFLGKVNDDSIEISVNGKYYTYLLDSCLKERNLVWELGIGAEIQLQTLQMINGLVVKQIVAL